MIASGRRDSWPWDERHALRRLGQAAFFVALVTILWTVDTLTKFSQLRFLGYAPDSFRLITEQVTSAVVVLLLVPCVAWWFKRFPLRRDRLVAAAAGHVLGSMLSAVAHYELRYRFDGGA